MKNDFVSIVVLTYNRKNLLNKCILSLLQQTYEGFEIIILDEFSNDGTGDLIKDFCKNNSNITLLQREKKGLGYGRNMGIIAATGDIIAFIDDDEEAHKNWLYNGVQALKQNNADVVLGAIYYPNGDLFKDISSTTLIWATANIFYRKKVIKEVGMFDEKFVFGSEDVDLGLRVFKNGYKMVVSEKAKTYHPQVESSHIASFVHLWKVKKYRLTNTVLRYKKHSDILSKDLLWGCILKETHLLPLYLILGCFLFPISFLGIAPFTIAFIKLRVATDRNYKKYLLRLIMLPYYTLVDSIELYYTLKGAFKYKHFIV